MVDDDGDKRLMECRNGDVRDDADGFSRLCMTSRVCARLMLKRLLTG